METELSLSIGGFPPFSARGCVQELTPISTGKFRRTIGQKLVYLGSSEVKYRSIIRGEDKQSLATAGLHAGAVITLGCIQMISQKIESNVVVLERDFVAGSLSIQDGEIVSVEGRRVVVTGGAFITYRPILTMRVIRYSLSTHEWEMKNTWELEMEEL